MEAIAESALVVAAPPGRIWRALEPAGLCGWLCEAASGSLDRGGELDLAWPSLGLATALAVADVVPQRRLLLHGSDDSAGQWQETLLEATADPGHTRVRIRHGGFGSGARAAERAAGSQAGWDVALRLLDLYLGGREGSPLAARSAVATSARPLAAVWEAVADPGALAAWLAPLDGRLEGRLDGRLEGSLAAEGERATVALGRGRHLAILLARAAPFELALTLPAVDAVLRLRLVGLGVGGTLVCLQLLGWTEDLLAPLEATLAGTLERLLAATGAPAEPDGQA
jgi:uncharacterized protein YndB with AHSA1/START domain